jgi:L-seryl-tRNA(Ser) seleniumtransferase
MEKSGATLVSVGTTNRTRIADYERAVTPRTAAILRVHPSNYRIVGFVEEASLGELVALGAKARVPVIDDLGSGALVDLSRYGLAREPLVRESVAAGADVVCFSGDKLLGGPQAGIVVGRSEVVARVRKNPLARALRVDKMTLAALEATLRLFASDDAEIARRHPVVRMIALDRTALRARAEALRARVAERCRGAVDADVVDEWSSVGGGSLPAESLETACLSVRHRAHSADALATALRGADVPVFSRVKGSRVLLDLRTIGEGADEDAIVLALARVAATG